MSELLSHYGLPLILTTDDGVTTLMTDDEARRGDAEPR